MTRKLIFLFILLTTGFFFLLNGIFGERGYYSNRELEKKIQEAEFLRTQRDVELEMLENRYEELNTEEGLRESAMRLGYNVSGDEIYRFDSPSLQETPVTSDRIESNDSVYSPVSTFILFIISGGFSALIVFLAYLIRKHGEEIEYDSKQKEPRDYSDSFFFNS